LRRDRLAITSKKRLTVLLNLPTALELSTHAETYAWSAIFLPKRATIRPEAV
jgi:tripartite-type tricarboxylate transporter receptor subunit TctC